MSPVVRWVLTRQLAVAFLFFGLLSAWSGVFHDGLSALIGGMVGVVGSAGYAWRSLRAPVGNAKQAFRAQQMGEFFRFASTILLFSLTFLLYREVSALPLFVAYAATLAVFWAALIKTN